MNSGLFVVVCVFFFCFFYALILCILMNSGLFVVVCFFFVFCFCGRGGGGGVSGAEIWPLSQWNLGDFFPQFLKKNPKLFFSF